MDLNAWRACTGTCLYADRYWGWPGVSFVALPTGPLGTQGQRDTHHIGHVLDEDLVAKFYPVDHVSRNVCPQVPLLSDELLQTQVGEDVFRADVHGPWEGKGCLLSDTLPLADRMPPHGPAPGLSRVEVSGVIRA